MPVAQLTRDNVSPKDPLPIEHNPYKTGRNVGLAIASISLAIILTGIGIGVIGDHRLSSALINRIVPAMIGGGAGVAILGITTLSAFWGKSSEIDAINKARKQQKKDELEKQKEANKKQKEEEEEVLEAK